MWENYFNYNTKMKSKLYLFTILGALFIAFFVPDISNPVFASVLYEKAGTGMDYSFSPQDAQNTVLRYAPNDATLTNTMNYAHKQDPAYTFYTVSNLDIQYFKIKRISGLTCENIGTNSIWIGNPWDDFIGFGNGVTQGDYCLLSRTSGTYGLHSGNNLYVVTISQASNIILDGNASNGGVSINDNPYSNATILAGGPAFQICDSGGCSGGFINPTPPSCTDGIQNQDETGIDTGGVCNPLTIQTNNCTNGVMDGDETAIDDGGRCNTHIIGFTPENDTTVTGPDVRFTMDVWVNPKDIGVLIGVNLSLHNIDQNVFVLGAFSPGDIYLLDNFRVPTAGLYQFDETKPLADGNYTLQADLTRAYLGGWVISPFSPINQSIYKKFIVGQSTFIGTIQQAGYDALAGTAGGAVVPGTTITTIASNCNPLASAFDVQKCGIYLFVPGGEYLNTSITGLKTGVLNRVP